MQAFADRYGDAFTGGVVLSLLDRLGSETDTDSSFDSMEVETPPLLGPAVVLQSVFVCFSWKVRKGHRGIDLHPDMHPAGNRIPMRRREEVVVCSSVVGLVRYRASAASIATELEHQSGRVGAGHCGPPRRHAHQRRDRIAIDAGAERADLLNYRARPTSRSCRDVELVRCIDGLE